MQAPADSHFNTVSIPQLGSETPTVLYRATTRVLRVLVRNVGGVQLILALESAALSANANPVSGTFRLPIGTSEVFVLMPKQTLVAVASGANGIASIAVSEAVPTLHMEA